MAHASFDNFVSPFPVQERNSRKEVVGLILCMQFKVKYDTPGC